MPARTVEDAKSEIIKLFQEAWELEQGFEYAGAYEDEASGAEARERAEPVHKYSIGTV